MHSDFYMYLFLMREDSKCKRKKSKKTTRIITLPLKENADEVSSELLWTEVLNLTISVFLGRAALWKKNVYLRLPYNRGENLIITA